MPSAQCPLHYSPHVEGGRKGYGWAAAAGKEEGGRSLSWAAAAAAAGLCASFSSFCAVRRGACNVHVMKSKRRRRRRKAERRNTPPVPC